MADLDGFAKQMNLIAKRVGDNAGALVRKVAVAVDGAVVLATPVDTGRARSNWQVEIDAKATGEAEPMSAQEAIALAKQKIATHKDGQTIHITNNLPYISALNNGSSAQAPKGFVEAAVEAGIETLRKANLLDDDLKDDT